MAEFKGLINRKVISFVPIMDAEGHHIYGPRFVDTIKHEGNPNAFEKSRLVVQAYKDTVHGLLTYAPSVQGVFQYLVFDMCAMNSDLELFARGVSRDYVQSETSSQRVVFVRSPKR